MIEIIEEKKQHKAAGLINGLSWDDKLKLKTLGTDYYPPFSYSFEKLQAYFPLC